MLVLNLPFKDLMFLTLMRPSLVLVLVLWLKLVKDFLKVRCRLARLPFLISCLIWLDLVASLPLIKERILVIILLLHFFFFQAEDGIRDRNVTGVQTCALPISDLYQGHRPGSPFWWGDLCVEQIEYVRNLTFSEVNLLRVNPSVPYRDPSRPYRSEERRVGKECRSRREA